jgi:hypothetical protein
LLCKEHARSRKTRKHDFLLGFADAIAKQNIDRRRAQETDASMSLVRLTDQLIRRHIYEQKIGKMGKVDLSSNINKDYMAGHRAGLNTSIESRTLKTSNKPRKALSE